MEVSYYLMENNLGVYSLFFAAYERAEAISNYILQNAPAEIIKAYYYDNLYDLSQDLPEGETGEEGTEEGEAPQEIPRSYDYQMGLYRTLFIGYQITFMDGNSIYDLYMESELRAFLNMTYDITWNYLYADEDPATPNFDRAKVLAALAKFRALTNEEQMLFILMEGENGSYYTALSAFIEEAFTENAAITVLKMLELEQSILMYANLPTEESRASLEKVMNELIDLYEALEGEDKTSFADMEQAYADYIAKSQALLNP